MAAVNNEYIAGFKAAIAAAAEAADKVRQKYGYDTTTAHVIWADILNIAVPE